jgi:Na+-transporting NADH:ubiquinone oxidoreductase subunit A
MKKDTEMAARFEISKGLAIPIAGDPDQRIDHKLVGQVALLTSDYLGLRPTLLVSEGDEVQLGQPVMIDKQTDGVVYVSPAGGRVRAIHRGEKRHLRSIVIDVADRETIRELPEIQGSSIASMSREDILERILATGLWTAFRTRPFSRIPSPKSIPRAIFVNAMDTNPLAVQPTKVIEGAMDDFAAGLTAVSRLTDGPIFVCRGSRTETPAANIPNVHLAEFVGPHPAGLVGTHMHFLSPASPSRVNWHLDYQDLIAIGRAFTRGRLDPSRVISLAGPVVSNPRLIQSRLGASLIELTQGELKGSDNRIVSGSILCGRQISEDVEYLGRYHLQVSCLAEGTQRELLGWQMPGFNKFSLTRAFAAAWSPQKKFSFTTNTEGSERAMVPIGSYERVMPLDLLPTLLLRALISRDTERAQELGCLELDEEDLALCTFVCPGKYDYGSILRDNLNSIEKEG